NRLSSFFLLFQKNSLFPSVSFFLFSFLSSSLFLFLSLFLYPRYLVLSFFPSYLSLLSYLFLSPPLVSLLFFECIYTAGGGPLRILYFQQSLLAISICIKEVPRLFPNSSVEKKRERKRSLLRQGGEKVCILRSFLSVLFSPLFLFISRCLTFLSFRLSWRRILHSLASTTLEEESRYRCERALLFLFLFPHLLQAYLGVGLIRPAFSSFFPPSITFTTATPTMPTLTSLPLLLICIYLFYG
ncbi:hypothetical protein CSUI_008842, partial [Cystoisospora suis]